eukprot:3934781-Rhodomonas_salina.1
MVRPVGSARNKDLGLTFARTMTVQERGYSLARQGRDSIYDVFAFCYPSAVRDNRRNGVTQMELNKALEALNFHRIRFRKKSKKSDSDGGDGEDKVQTLGSYRFGDRRWLNPDNESELATIKAGWETLSEIQRPECKLENWLTMLRAAIASNQEFIKCYEQRGTTDWVAPPIKVEKPQDKDESTASSKKRSIPSGLDSLISAAGLPDAQPEPASSSSELAPPSLDIAGLPFLLRG